MAKKAEAPSTDLSVYCLRLPREVIEGIKAVAAREGVKPSVMLRRWVQERLDKEGS